MKQRQKAWQEAASHRGSALAVLAALALAAAPAVAQQNGCQAALAQVDQARSTIITKTQDALNTLATDRRNAMRECLNKAQPNDPNSGKVVDECLKAIDAAYRPAQTEITN